MYSKSVVTAILLGGALASPLDKRQTATITSAPADASATASYIGNPFAGVNQWANSFYAKEITEQAVPALLGDKATAAAKVAEVPTFLWMDAQAKVPVAASELAKIREANKAATTPNAALLVVYNLPDRDCAAAASNGELSIANGGAALYKTYIDSIYDMLVEYSDIRTILVLEPDSLANLVTNLNVAKCSDAQDVYKELTVYAMQKLDLPNVAIYLDAGHAGWLGWPANLDPAAQLFTSIYQTAGKPRAVRGLATNVSNYNGWNVTSAPPYTTPNANYDEQLYVAALSPLLASGGFDAHFIADTGRSGKQPTGQTEWGHWCNAVGTGFGTRPTVNTGDEKADAFVWVKPGGECDGTSNTTAIRYDYHCGLADALQPAPEAGSWFQAYFEQLLENASPAF